jgi:TRAP transporter TAXI family solute receptor
VGSGFAWKGIYDFASLDWGPQPLRQVWAVLPYGMTLATAADANIKMPRDLRGKRVGWIPGNPAINTGQEAFLAFANFTWKDVQKTIFPSYGAALRGLVEGTNDALFCNTTAAALYELASSPRGIFWPEFPANDREGWTRLQRVAPFFFPDTVNTGAGISSPKALANYSYPVLVCYLQREEESVYQLAKALYETYETYKKINVSMLGWEMKKAIRSPGMVPYHKGAIRFFREVGQWSADLENWNHKALEEEQGRMAAWEKFKKEAVEKKMSSKEVANTWMKSQGMEPE